MFKGNWWEECSQWTRKRVVGYRNAECFRDWRYVQGEWVRTRALSGYNKALGAMEMHSALQNEIISKENGGDLNSQRTQDKVMSYENS